jgi:hypothetical protein
LSLEPIRTYRASSAGLVCRVFVGSDFFFALSLDTLLTKSESGQHWQCLTVVRIYSRSLVNRATSNLASRLTCSYD